MRLQISRLRNFLLHFVIIATILCQGCQKKTDTPKPSSTQSSQQQKESQHPPMGIQSESFGQLDDGTEITIYHLNNDNGMQVSIINYGAIVTSVKTPDREGNFENITLGFDTLDGYLKGHPYFGAIVGRYANRIAKGKFNLNGKEYTLATNNDENHLHGGEQGFDKRVWTAETIKNEDSAGLKLTYVSEDGEEGYPGELTVTVIYTVTNKNELKVDYEAVAKADTVLNLTNHCYWNLSTPKMGEILEHELTLNCDHYLPVDETLIPTGELAEVKGTPMDFTKPMTIGSRFSEVKGEEEFGGYDHCYVINTSDKPLRLAATVVDRKFGRMMEIYTDQPGIQFYSGNFLNKESPGQYGQQFAFCLETQHFPDSPNQPDFPSTVLKAGHVFRSTTIHQFSVVDKESEDS